jgi:hypothetical protein
MQLVESAPRLGGRRGPGSDLRLGAQCGERRPQLMGCIGREATLARCYW